MEQTLFSHVAARVQTTTPTSHFRCRYQRNLPLVRVRQLILWVPLLLRLLLTCPEAGCRYTHHAQLLSIIGLWGKHESTSANLVRLWCKAPGQLLSISPCHQKCAAIPTQSSFIKCMTALREIRQKRRKNCCSLIVQLALAKQESSPLTCAHSI